MNEVIKNMMTRHSTRAYSSKKVEKEILEQIVEAGRMAPSGMNRQSFAFVVVQNPDMVKKLSVLNAAVMNSDKDPFYGASTVIVVLAKKDVPTHLYDGALAMENLMLAAHSFGVSSCWIHRAKETYESLEGQELLKKWGLEGYEGIGNCILGYASDSSYAPKERTSIVIWE